MSTLVTLSLVFIAQANLVRLWFSTTGVAENEPIAGTPAEFRAPFDGDNPVLDGAAGTHRLYIWGSILTRLPNAITRLATLSLDVELRVERGMAHFRDHRFYNVVAPPYRRWDAVDQGSRASYLIDDVLAVAVTGAGLYEDAGANDLQFDFATASYLLGFADIEASSDAIAQIYFGIGRNGIQIHGAGPTDSGIFFGWGDVALYPDIGGPRSALADAFIVPEPGTLVLLGVGSLAIMRRRWRGSAC
ncbi:MAG: PEP-CTERM sorting domain-containing protein [Phycisphaerae bacterium]